MVLSLLAGSFWCLLSHVQIKLVEYNTMEAECGQSMSQLCVLVQCDMEEVE